MVFIVSSSYKLYVVKIYSIASLAGKPKNINQVSASSTTVTLEWMVSHNYYKTVFLRTYTMFGVLFDFTFQIPPVSNDTAFVRHRVFVHKQMSFDVIGKQIKSFLTKTFQYSVNQNNLFSVVIHSLEKNTSYFVRLQTQTKGFCNSQSNKNVGFIQGTPSIIRVKTAAESK